MLTERRSLEQLEGEDWGAPDSARTPLIARCLHLRKRPLDTLELGDIRLLVGQQIGLEYIVPAALGLIAVDVLKEADLYPGDLLYALLRVDNGYWSLHPTELSWMESILKEFTTKYGKIISDCESFLEAKCIKPASDE